MDSTADGARTRAIRALQRSLGNRAVQRLVVQRVRIYWKDATIRAAREKDDVRFVFETSTLSEERRKELRAALQQAKGDGALLRSIEDEWDRAAKAAEAPPALGDLLGIGEELTPLEAIKDKLDEKQTLLLAGIIERLEQALRALVNVKLEADAGLLRDTVQGLLLRANTIWTSRPHSAEVRIKSVGGAGGLAVRAEEFTQPEVAAYRNDVRQQGVWGGLAEASTAAIALNRSVDIFTVGPDGNYRRIISIGQGAAMPNGSLLHRGNHYEVVQGAVVGQPHLPGHIVGTTRVIGDCLYEGLLIAKFGAVPNATIPNAQGLDKAIQTLRNATAAALTEDQIRTSLLQVVSQGEYAGLGPRTRQMVKSRARPPDAVSEQLKSRKLDGAEIELLKSYAQAWKDNPASEVTGALYDRVSELLAKEAPGATPFESLAADTEAGMYAIKTAKSSKIRMSSGEKDFPSQAGISVAQAVQEAIDALDLTGSISVAYSRHDFQPAKSGTYNLQVQLGGSKLNYRVKQGDTSSTLVIIPEALFDRMVKSDAKRWVKVLQAAHRQSFNESLRIEFVEPPSKQDSGKPAKS